MSSPSRALSPSRSSRETVRSWRKPVPKYIPSPPPSPPPSSPEASLQRLSLSLGSALSTDLPPLPMDWRETIERALADFDRSATVFSENNNSQPSLPFASHVYNIPPIIIKNADALDEVDVVDVRGYESEPEMRRNRKKSVNRSVLVSLDAQSSVSASRSAINYRPPTPPIRSHKKPRRSDSQLSMAGMMKRGELVYPDLAGLGEVDSTRRATASGSESSTFAPGANSPRHPVPPFLTSWLSLRDGSVDTATLVDEPVLPSYYCGKPSTDSTIAVVDSSFARAASHLVKDWTGLVARKFQKFGKHVALICKFLCC